MSESGLSLIQGAKEALGFAKGKNTGCVAPMYPMKLMLQQYDLNPICHKSNFHHCLD